MWIQRIMTSLPTDNGVLWPGAHRSGKLSFKASFTLLLRLFQAFLYNIEVYGKTPKKLPYLERAVFKKNKKKHHESKKQAMGGKNTTKKCIVVLSITPWLTANTWLWGFVPRLFIAFSLKTTLCITTIMANLKQGNWSILEKKINKDFALNECICSKFETNYHDNAIIILNKCDWTQIILPLQGEFFFYYKIQNMQKYFPHPKKRILIEPLTCCALVLGSDVGCLSSTGNKCISSYITIQVIFK